MFKKVTEQILELTEYFSITPDDGNLISDNKELNQMKSNDSEASNLNLGKHNTFEHLLNMNSEEIGNVKVINRKKNLNHDLLMLDNEAVNVAESEYFSMNPDVTSINDNSATPDIYFENTDAKTKILKTHPLKELLEMNSDEWWFRWTSSKNSRKGNQDFSLKLFKANPLTPGLL